MVNRELANLRKSIMEGVDLLNPKGRICIISFHSLEDRIVKHVLKELAKQSLDSASTVEYRILTKRPITPSLEEKNLNHRARSAKFRVLERVA